MSVFTSYSKIPTNSINWDKSYKKIKQWAVTEKVHGANFSFIYDVSSKQFTYAKRTGLLTEEDNFFGYKQIIPNIQPKISEIVNDVLKNYKECLSITVFGELFGEGVQSGIYYSPKLHFYAFDIYVTCITNAFYLDFDESIKLFDRVNILYSKPLKIYNSYEKAIQHKIGFNSTIPELLDITYESENKAEGIVVRSMKNHFITKIKIPEFSESKYDDNNYQDVTLSQLDIYKLKSEQHITTNRLNNAISKIGCFNEHKEEIYELMVNDILDEINGYHIYGLHEWILNKVKEFIIT